MAESAVSGALLGLWTLRVRGVGAEGLPAPDKGPADTTVEALIITNTIVGFLVGKNSMIYPPKPYSDYIKAPILHQSFYQDSTTNWALVSLDP